MTTSYYRHNYTAIGGNQVEAYNTTYLSPDRRGNHCTLTPERNRIRCIQLEEVTMPTMTMRLDETDAEIVRKYAEFEGKTISDFVRDAVFEKIEDQQDLATLREAIAADNGVRYTHEQILAQLGL